MSSNRETNKIFTPPGRILLGLAFLGLGLTWGIGTYIEVYGESTFATVCIGISFWGAVLCGFLCLVCEEMLSERDRKK